MSKEKPALIDIDGCSKGVANYFADIIMAGFDCIPIGFLYTLNDKFANAINSKIILNAIRLLPDILEDKLKKKD